MESPEISAKRTRLNNLLSKLALSDDLLSDKSGRIEVYLELEAIYYSPNKNNEFRHYYSDIFAKVFDIKSDETLSSGSLEILMANLWFLNEHYQSKNTDENGNAIDVSKSIHKLYDHVSLEVARMAYSDKGDIYVANQGTTLMNLSNKVEEIQSESNNIRDSIEKSKLDYIAILGIFASVVLAFVGGMAFSTSVLENIKGVSIYRLLIVALVVGIVFVTVIFFMFYFLGVLARQKLFNLKTCIPLGIVYLIFGILIAIVFTMWQKGTVELRDDEIRKHFESIESEAAETSVEPDITSQIYFEQNSATTE